MITQESFYKKNYDRIAGVLEQIAAEIRAGKYDYVKMNAHRGVRTYVLPGENFIRNDLNGNSDYRLELHEKKDFGEPQKEEGEA